MSTPRIGIVAAMAGEVAPLVRSARLKRVAGGRLNVFESDHFVIAYAGMGRERALESCEAVAARGPLSMIMSAGWAGALNERSAAASVQRPSMVVDVTTGEKFEVSGVPDGPVLVTAPQVAGASEKLNLAARWNADLVDMEAAQVAQFARTHGLPFSCIRAVSDAHDAVLPDMNLFTTPDGQFELFKFARWAAVRPRWWPAIARMGRHSAVSAKAMCEEIGDL